jgi:nucleoid-associated protein YgaU
MLTLLLLGVASSSATASQLFIPDPKPATSAIHPRVVESAGYITPVPMFLATIIYSLEERQYVAAGDRVVIDAGEDKGLHHGMQLTVMRPATAVSQPVTNELLGITIVPVGTAMVEQVQPTIAFIRILHAFDAMQPGDVVKPFEAPQPILTNARHPTQGRIIKGIIVATKDDKVAAGPGDIVYLNQGKQHGVEIGDRFYILQESQIIEHPVLQRTAELPPQILGTLDAIDVRDRTATALITAGQREFAVGTPVELAPPSDGDQAASARRREAEVAAPSSTQVAAYRSQLFPCLEAARHAIRAAAVAGVQPAELIAAQQALSHAEALLERVDSLLAQGQVEQALAQLRMVETDCLAAQELSTEARLLTAGRQPAPPDQYRVMRGDSLWSISGQERIYRNPLMWPILYKANRQQLRDPDRLFPQQILAIPRHLSQEEISTTIQRARTRGPWRQGDGQDTYILEGVRR